MLCIMYSPEKSLSDFQRRQLQAALKKHAYAFELIPELVRLYAYAYADNNRNTKKVRENFHNSEIGEEVIELTKDMANPESQQRLSLILKLAERRLALSVLNNLAEHGTIFAEDTPGIRNAKAIHTHNFTAPEEMLDVLDLSIAMDDYSSAFAKLCANSPESLTELESVAMENIPGFLLIIEKAVAMIKAIPEANALSRFRAEIKEHWPDNRSFRKDFEAAFQAHGAQAGEGSAQIKSTEFMQRMISRRGPTRTGRE